MRTSIPRRTRVKVCGITSLSDAKTAVDAGADALGFIFVEKSPRYVSPEKAKEIISQLPPFVSFVGVFVDQDPVEVEEIIDYCGLTFVQLHGAEDREYCLNLSQTVSPCRLLKAFRVGASTTAAEFSPYNDCVHGFLLDTYVDGQEGGTGRTFDWSVVSSLEMALPVVLAGGLNTVNVTEALATVVPFAVDVNSGVELEPGKKVPDLVRTFIGRVAEADAARCLAAAGNHDLSGE